MPPAPQIISLIDNKNDNYAKDVEYGKQRNVCERCLTEYNGR